jgi:hypothetical protein
MERLVHALITMVAVAAGLLLFAAGVAGAGRSVLVLSWDDGTAEGSTSGLIGDNLAVGFQAPPGYRELLGMHMYSVEDGLENPVDPQLPSTKPFTACVWRLGTEGEPGVQHACYVPFTGLYEYPEDAWVEVAPPEPIDLSDSSHFPEGRFFIGIRWDYRDSPCVGLDLDPPISGESWFYWGASDTANIMIRAVVCDSTGTPVELESWGTVKQRYR